MYHANAVDMLPKRRRPAALPRSTSKSTFQRQATGRAHAVKAPWSAARHLTGRHHTLTRGAPVSNDVGAMAGDDQEGSHHAGHGIHRRAGGPPRRRRPRCAVVLEPRRQRLAPAAGPRHKALPAARCRRASLAGGAAPRRRRGPGARRRGSKGLSAALASPAARRPACVADVSPRLTFAAAV